jgi:hypothetical protein
VLILGFLKNYPKLGREWFPSLKKLKKLYFTLERGLGTL